jgi:hypothetical protein
VPLDDSGRLDQHHRVQTARPQLVEPDPEQAVDREQSEPPRSLAMENVQLMTEGEVLKFEDRATPESADKSRNDGTHELEHAGNTTAALTKTLDFSRHSELSVGTPPCAEA